MRATVEDSPKGVSLAHSPVPSSVTSSSTFSSPSWMWQLLGLFLLVVVTSATRPYWHARGCFRVGHTRLIEITGCVAFNITTNGCNGYCISYAIDNSAWMNYDHHRLTSYGECCSIRDTHDVNVRLRCRDGMRNLTFKSASTCSCSYCKIA